MKVPIRNPAAGGAPVAHMRLPDLPRLVPVHDGQRVFGPSRATWYRAAAAGQIRMVKLGRASYLDTESVLAFLAALPEVTLTPAA